MLFRTLYLIILLILQISVKGQSVLPPVYEIISDTQVNYTLSSEYYKMLTDEGGKLSIDQVMTPPVSEKFFYRNNAPAGLDTVVKTYWFRYKVKNILDDSLKIGLDSYGDESFFYVIRNNGKREQYFTGSRIAWNKKDGMQKDNIVPITIAAGEEITIYYRLQNLIPGLRQNFLVNLINIENYLARTYEERMTFVGTEELFRFVFSGFCLLAVIFNLFFFRIAREKVYLYFSLFLFIIFYLTSPLFIFLVRNYPVVDFYLVKILNPLTFLIFAQFIRHYFQTFKYTPLWDRIVLGLMLLYVVIEILFFYSNNYVISAIASNIIVELGCIISIFLFYRKEPTLTKYFVYATLPFALVIFLLTILEIIALSGLIPPGSLFILMSNLLFISIAWAILFFTWVLFKQFENQRKDVAETKLQVERLAKEKEIERRELIELQKAELETKVNERTSELNKSLQELKVTQSQLIQSEKMASLGELTAGIAHEIQNPLNFVNNFSEVNTELIEELKDELKTGNMQGAMVIADGIRENEQKISHHGKRADAIVKGMLQHSRNNSSKKEPTNINALADEYLRLAYHGLRAKDNSFNATFKTHYDESIGNSNIVPQDMGRVLLNLITNAFYAVNEKSKKLKASGSNTYHPTVTITTKKTDENIQIKIKDNGDGIQQKVLDKIFQPFFTTKPTGEGTGLGLSLSYDIVKAHGGELKVETKVGEGSEFIVELHSI